MDIKQLTALVTVAEVGSVTRAARLLDVVQPAVTRQIKLLEKELGVQLFERSPQGMVPTPEGKLLVERARRALLELEKARIELRPDPVGVKGQVTVGVLDSAVRVLVGPLADVVATKYPGIALRIMAGYTGHLQSWLEDAGDLDMTVLYDVADSPSVAVVPLIEESLWVIAPLSAGLKPDEPLPWKRIFTQPLILPVAGNGLRILIDQARVSADVLPRIALETNSFRIQRELVSAGHGWSVMPGTGALPEILSGRLSGCPVSEPETHRKVVLALRRGGRVPAPVDAVAKEIVTLVRSLAKNGDWPSARPLRRE